MFFCTFPLALAIGLIAITYSDSVGDSFLKGPLSCDQIEFSDDENLVFTHWADQQIRCWNLRNKEKIDFPCLKKKEFAWFSPLGKEDFLVASRFGRIEIYDLKQSKLIHSISPLRGAERLMVAAISEDKRRLAIVVLKVDGSHVQLYDVPTLKLIRSLGQTTEEISALCFTKAGALLGTGHGNKAKVWDAETGRELASFNSGQGRIHTLTFSRISDLMASGGEDEVVRVWDIGRNELVKELSGHKGSIYCLQFCLDGKSILSASTSGTPIVWSLVSGKAIHSMSIQDAGVSVGRFSNSGRLLCYGHRNLRLWDYEKMVELSRPLSVIGTPRTGR